MLDSHLIPPEVPHCGSDESCGECLYRVNTLMNDVRAVDELLPCQSQSLVVVGHRPSDGHLNDVIGDASNSGPKPLRPVFEESSMLLCAGTFIPIPDLEEAWSRPGFSCRKNGEHYFGIRLTFEQIQVRHQCCVWRNSEYGPCGRFDLVVLRILCLARGEPLKDIDLASHVNQLIRGYFAVELHAFDDPLELVLISQDDWCSCSTGSKVSKRLNSLRPGNAKQLVRVTHMMCSEW